MCTAPMISAAPSAARGSPGTATLGMCCSRRLSRRSSVRAKRWTACSPARTSVQRTSYSRSGLTTDTAVNVTVVNALQGGMVKKFAADGGFAVEAAHSKK